MRKWFGSAVVAAGLLLAIGAAAQTPAPATTPTATPVTATCKDGTAFSGPSLKGACRGHGGIAKGATASAPSTPAGTAAATPAATSSMAAPPPKTSKKGPQPAAVAKPGGGPGLVWVNTDSKAYHCNGSRWYGKTKTGEYMTESAAKAGGFHAASSKACTS